MVAATPVSRGKSIAFSQSVGAQPAGIPVAQRIPPRSGSPAGRVAKTTFRDRAATVAESAGIPRDAAVGQFPVAESPAGVARFLWVAESAAVATCLSRESARELEREKSEREKSQEKSIEKCVKEKSFKEKSKRKSEEKSEEKSFKKKSS